MVVIQNAETEAAFRKFKPRRRRRTQENFYPSDADHHPSRGRRRLSRLDFKPHVGTLKVATTVEEDGNKGTTSSIPDKWIFMHIPKTAGDSFMLDARQHMFTTTQLQGNKEKPLHHDSMKQQQQQKRKRQGQPILPVVTLFRNPSNHVLSQFLECKYDGWGKASTKGTQFPGTNRSSTLQGYDEWIHQFIQLESHHDYSDPSQAYNCYDPWNMQARYLTSTTNSGHLAKTEDDRIPNVTLALQNLDELQVFGLVEYYEASLCLFEYVATGKNPLAPFGSRECQTICHHEDGGGVTVPPQTRQTHHVPPHSLEDITNITTLAYMDTLTQIDQAVYQVALQRFLQQIDEVHAEAGVDLLCRPLNNDNDNHDNNNNETSLDLVKDEDDFNVFDGSLQTVDQVVNADVSVSGTQPIQQPIQSTTTTQIHWNDTAAPMRSDVQWQYGTYSSSMPSLPTTSNRMVLLGLVAFVGFLWVGSILRFRWQLLRFRWQRKDSATKTTTSTNPRKTWHYCNTLVWGSCMLALLGMVSLYYEMSQVRSYQTTPTTVFIEEQVQHKDTVVRTHPMHNQGFAACILTMDDNHIWPEWLAYHYQVMPLRRLIVATDPKSRTSPRELFDRYNTTEYNLSMDITVWENDEFLSKQKERLQILQSQRSDFEKYIRRQAWFLQSCIRQLYQEGWAWILLVDTDEFVVPDSALASRFLSYPHYYSILTEHAQQVTQNYRKKTKNQWATVLETGCMVMPRSRFLPPNATAASGPIGSLGTTPHGTNISLMTATQTWYQTQRNYKTMLDLSKVPPKLAQNIFSRQGKRHDAFNPHSGIPGMCRSSIERARRPNPHKTYFFKVHHYAMSLDQILARSNDPRISTRIQQYHKEQATLSSNSNSNSNSRTKRKKVKQFDATRNPFASQWIAKFQQSVSPELAADLLRPLSTA